MTSACNGPLIAPFFHCFFWDFPLEFKWWNCSFTTSNLCIPFCNLKGIWGWDSHHRRENHQGISTFWTPCASFDLQVKRMAEDLIWFPVLHPEVLQRGPKWWEVMGSMLILWWVWVGFGSMTWHTLRTTIRSVFRAQGSPRCRHLEISPKRCPKRWWLSKGNPLVSGKPRLVKYYSLARSYVSFLYGTRFS